MSTRSKTILEGNLTEYLLKPSNKKRPCRESASIEIMPENEDNTVQMTEHQQTMAILGKLTETISVLAGNTGQQAQVNMQLYNKLEDCPIRKKTVSLESWLREVELWNDCNKVDQNSYGKKYQKFITSIRNSEDSEEINAVANAEFVENINFDRTKDDTVKKMIDILKTKLGSTDFEKSTEAWLNFVNIKQKDDETLKEFCSRFSQAETMLKNAGLEMKESALAIHLLHQTNLNNVSRENVMTKVNTEDKDNLYKNMTKAIKDIKSLSIKEDLGDKNKVFYSEQRNSRSRSRNRYQNSDFDRNSRTRSKNQYQNNSSDSKPWRSKSRESNFRRESRSPSQRSFNERNYQNNSSQRNRSSSRNQNNAGQKHGNSAHNFGGGGGVRHRSSSRQRYFNDGAGADRRHNGGQLHDEGRT